MQSNNDSLEEQTIIKTVPSFTGFVTRLCHCNLCGATLSIEDLCNYHISSVLAPSKGSEFNGAIFDITLCTGCTDKFLSHLVNNSVISPIRMFNRNEDIKS